MKTKMLLASSVLGVAVSYGAATATVTSIRQNWPWDSRVTIGYTLSGATEKCSVTAVSVKCRPGAEYSYGNVPLALSAIRGDVSGVANGTHEIVWDPALDTLTNVVRIVDVQFELSVAEESAADSAKPEYLVIDLSGGTAASSWPATAVDTLDPTADEYKTTKLVLRRIRPGTFQQSSPSDEPMRKDSYESRGEVTLTNDYWIGVYELTQRQYELMTGAAGATGQGGAYPRHSIKFSDVRGSSLGRLWPRSSDVDDDSLVGKLRSKVSLPAGIPDGWKFDLPTEAQWEYACRAGTDTPWNNGKSINVYTNDAGFACDDGLDAVGWYAANSGGSLHKVGLRMPNRFGLYDMHGNLWEMTLGVIYWTNAPISGTEPRGADYAASAFPDYGDSYRVVRGGCYRNTAESFYTDGFPETAVAMCRAAARSRIYRYERDYVGLRLALRYSLDNAGHEGY